jgi:hypothetical protein
VITRLLTRESSNQGRGDLAIGIWSEPTAGDSVWRVYSGLTQPGVRPVLSSMAATMKARSIEPGTGPYRDNAVGLSVPGWSLVIGAYANSFPAAANWICSNFGPQEAPFVDPRPRAEALEQLSIQPAPACPPIQFLAVRKKSSESATERFRSSLNLPAVNPNDESEDTIYLSVSRENDPHPLPIRVSLLWLARVR